MKRGFVIHHNGPPANCLGKPHTRCEIFWAAVKSFHQTQWPRSNDIAYSFGVCPHGARFTGRGWDKPQYANGDDIVGPEDGSNVEWFSVLAFVGGGYRKTDGTWVPEERPTTAMIEGLKRVIHEGRETHRCGLKVLPHSDFKPKPCPGPTLTVLARDWDGKPLLDPPLPVNKDDLMDAFLYKGPGPAVFFCHAGKSVGLNELSDLQAILKAAPELKTLPLDEDTFQKFRERYPGD